MLYFDFAASTPIYPEVLEVMKASLETEFANPNAGHRLGKELMQKLENVRHSIYHQIGVSDQRFDFFFTSSATESNNTIIKGLHFEDGDQVLGSYADHASIFNPLDYIAEKRVEFIQLPFKNDGRLDVDTLLTFINEKTKLICLTLVNHQTGVINPVNEIAKEIKKINKEVFIHIDGAQGVGKVPFEFENELVDSLAISAHKIGGPKGIAGLFVKKSTIHPLLHGGGQELGLRSSTQSLALALGLQDALKISYENQKENWEKLKVLENRLLEGVMDRKDDFIIPFFSGPDKSPYITSLIVPKFSSDIIMRHLEQKDIFISSTSACSTKIKGKNKSFAALNIPEKQHKNVLRISFGPSVKEGDVDHLITAIIDVIDELKLFS